MSESAADLAINRVLAAEQEARDQVEHCRREGERRIEQARLDSRRILDRVDQRIGRVHALADRAIGAAKGRMDDDARRLAEHDQLDDGEHQELDRAVDLLLGDWLGDA